ncbi:nucleotide-diphospho-sugar transferase [Sphaerosporella brunnea]|uniref:Nucleotide-diphospho-sugar transferase n=1 Tax=Sphaerosporella brunnea TaxID=1250544 RepID=A0A5J5F4S0_9PEZI|nr:nucleotide-diphospho-sugar transferase [Sphaerosporella brunnea]
MDGKFTLLPRRGGSLRGSLPKFLIAIILLCTVLVWLAGSVYRRDTLASAPLAADRPTPTHISYEPDSISGFVETPAPPPVEEQPTTPNSKVGLKHWWGVESPYHFRGEGPRNRTQIGREKASLVMLVRNRELKDALSAMKDIEDRFNRHYRYPWTFFNDEPFSEEFKLHTSRMASGEVQYGLIPKEHWSLPTNIDEKKFREKMKEMADKKIIYGGSESYRHMCRYNSGFFWQSPLLKDFDWYWRVEPSTSFYCDQLYDPFTFMRENGKRYSFVMTMYEFRATIETLWSSTREFAKKHPEYIAEDNSLGFIVDDYKDKNSLFKKDFNLCHFWSNFEIADLNLWRSQAYRDYFAFLDAKGGFFYERWGDAPVHSIAASLFLPKDQIHFFHDIGYRHPPYKRCPQDDESTDYGRCQCPFNKGESFDFDGYSCQKRWWKFHNQDDSGNPIPSYKIPDF